MDKTGLLYPHSFASENPFPPSLLAANELQECEAQVEFPLPLAAPDPTVASETDKCLLVPLLEDSDEKNPVGMRDVENGGSMFTQNTASEAVNNEEFTFSSFREYLTGGESMPVEKEINREDATDGITGSGLIDSGLAQVNSPAAESFGSCGQLSRQGEPNICSSLQSVECGDHLTAPEMLLGPELAMLGHREQGSMHKGTDGSVILIVGDETRNSNYLATGGAENDTYVLVASAEGLVNESQVRDRLSNVAVTGDKLKSNLLKSNLLEEVAEDKVSTILLSVATPEMAETVKDGESLSMLAWECEQRDSAETKTEEKTSEDTMHSPGETEKDRTPLELRSSSEPAAQGQLRILESELPETINTDDKTSLQKDIFPESASCQETVEYMSSSLKSHKEGDVSKELVQPLSSCIKHPEVSQIEKQGISGAGCVVHQEEETNVGDLTSGDHDKALRENTDHSVDFTHESDNVSPRGNTDLWKYPSKDYHTVLNISSKRRASFQDSADDLNPQSTTEPAVSSQLLKDSAQPLGSYPEISSDPKKEEISQSNKEETKPLNREKTGEQLTSSVGLQEDILSSLGPDSAIHVESNLSKNGNDTETVCKSSKNKPIETRENSNNLGNTACVEVLESTPLLQCQALQQENSFPNTETEPREEPSCKLETEKEDRTVSSESELTSLSYFGLACTSDPLDDPRKESYRVLNIFSEGRAQDSGDGSQSTTELVHFNLLELSYGNKGTCNPEENAHKELVNQTEPNAVAENVECQLAAEFPCTAAVGTEASDLHSNIPICENLHENADLNSQDRALGSDSGSETLECEHISERNMQELVSYWGSETLQLESGQVETGESQQQGDNTQAEYMKPDSVSVAAASVLPLVTTPVIKKQCGLITDNEPEYTNNKDLESAVEGSLQSSITESAKSPVVFHSSLTSSCLADPAQNSIYPKREPNYNNPELDAIKKDVPESIAIKGNDFEIYESNDQESCGKDTRAEKDNELPKNSDLLLAVQKDALSLEELKQMILDKDLCKVNQNSQGRSISGSVAFQNADVTTNQTMLSSESLLQMKSDCLTAGVHAVEVAENICRDFQKTELTQNNELQESLTALCNNAVNLNEEAINICGGDLNETKSTETELTVPYLSAAQPPNLSTDDKQLSETLDSTRDTFRIELPQQHLNGKSQHNDTEKALSPDAASRSQSMPYSIISNKPLELASHTDCHTLSACEDYTIASENRKDHIIGTTSCLILPDNTSGVKSLLQMSSLLDLLTDCNTKHPDSEDMPGTVCEATVPVCKDSSGNNDSAQGNPSEAGPCPAISAGVPKLEKNALDSEGLHQEEKCERIPAIEEKQIQSTSELLAVSHALAPDVPSDTLHSITGLCELTAIRTTDESVQPFRVSIPKVGDGILEDNVPANTAVSSQLINVSAQHHRSKPEISSSFEKEEMSQSNNEETKPIDSEKTPKHLASSVGLQEDHLYSLFPDTTIHVESNLSEKGNDAETVCRNSKNETRVNSNNLVNTACVEVLECASPLQNQALRQENSFPNTETEPREEPACKSETEKKERPFPSESELTSLSDLGLACPDLCERAVLGDRSGFSKLGHICANEQPLAVCADIAKEGDCVLESKPYFVARETISDSQLLAETSEPRENQLELSYDTKDRETCQKACEPSKLENVCADSLSQIQWGISPPEISGGLQAVQDSSEAFQQQGNLLELRYDDLGRNTWSGEANEPMSSSPQTDSMNLGTPQIQCGLSNAEDKETLSLSYSCEKQHDSGSELANSAHPCPAPVCDNEEPSPLAEAIKHVSVLDEPDHLTDLMVPSGLELVCLKAIELKHCGKNENNLASELHTPESIMPGQGSRDVPNTEEYLVSTADNKQPDSSATEQVTDRLDNTGNLQGGTLEVTWGPITQTEDAESLKSYLNHVGSQHENSMKVDVSNYSDAAKAWENKPDVEERLQLIPKANKLVYFSEPLDASSALRRDEKQPGEPECLQGNEHLAQACEEGRGEVRESILPNSENRGVSEMGDSLNSQPVTAQQMPQESLSEFSWHTGVGLESVKSNSILRDSSQVVSYLPEKEATISPYNSEQDVPIMEITDVLKIVNDSKELHDQTQAGENINLRHDSQQVTATKLESNVIKDVVYSQIDTGFKLDPAVPTAASSINVSSSEGEQSITTENVPNLQTNISEIIATSITKDSVPSEAADPQETVLGLIIRKQEELILEHETACEGDPIISKQEELILEHETACEGDPIISKQEELILKHETACEGDPIISKQEELILEHETACEGNLESIPKSADFPNKADTMEADEPLLNEAHCKAKLPPIPPAAEVCFSAESESSALGSLESRKGQEADAEASGPDKGMEREQNCIEYFSGSDTDVSILLPPITSPHENANLLLVADKNSDKMHLHTTTVAEDPEASPTTHTPRLEGPVTQDKAKAESAILTTECEESVNPVAVPPVAVPSLAAREDYKEETLPIEQAWPDTPPRFNTEHTTKVLYHPTAFGSNTEQSTKVLYRPTAFRFNTEHTTKVLYRPTAFGSNTEHTTKVLYHPTAFGCNTEHTTKVLYHPTAFGSNTEHTTKVLYRPTAFGSNTEHTTKVLYHPTAFGSNTEHTTKVLYHPTAFGSNTEHTTKVLYRPTAFGSNTEHTTKVLYHPTAFGCNTEHTTKVLYHPTAFGSNTEHTTKVLYHPTAFGSNTEHTTKVLYHPTAFGSNTEHTTKVLYHPTAFGSNTEHTTKVLYHPTAFGSNTEHTTKRVAGLQSLFLSIRGACRSTLSEHRQNLHNSMKVEVIDLTLDSSSDEDEDDEPPAKRSCTSLSPASPPISKGVLNLHHQASPGPRTPSMSTVDSSYIPPPPPLIQDYRHSYHTLPYELQGLDFFSFLQGDNQHYGTTLLAAAAAAASASEDHDILHPSLNRFLPYSSSQMFLEQPSTPVSSTLAPANGSSSSSI
ncbi:UNVERIFIED_CONTAM: hypothetical protein FKN15_007366 [Acipenser sinensis]